MWSKVTYFAQKAPFIEGYKPPFLDKEAAVDELIKNTFHDKALIDNELLQIDEGQQNDQKPPPNAPKSGGKKNFHFGDFSVKKWGKVGILRKR